MGCTSMTRGRGFTLVELMVTLAVLAILLAAAVPSFTDFIDRYRLRGAVDDVVSMISNARAEAVKRDRDVAINIGGGSGWCAGANAAVDPVGGAPAATAGACNCATAGSCLVGGEPMRIEPGKHRGVSAGGGANFIFDSKLGVVTPLGAASTTFTSPSAKYDIRIDVNALGQSTVCVPAGKPVIAGVRPC